VTTSKRQKSEREYYPALRGRFGDWVYYSSLMPLKDVARRLSFADEIHKSKKLSEWIQRQLKKGRSKEISKYLNREKQRFFNSLVVAIYGGDPAWHGFSDFRPIGHGIELREVPDSVEDSVGFLSFSGREEMFAIDGQHRLAGIKEAVSTNPSIGDDEISLLFVAHRKTKAGQEQTRRLFTTLNKTAKPVGKGEIIALDEDDVMAIVTRHLVENDPRFSDVRIKFSQTDNLPVDAPELTTIGNLYDVLTTVFVASTDTKRKSVLRFVRPDDAKLQEYVELAEEFFSGLAAAFPPLEKYFDREDAAAARLVARQRTSSGGHILFRPVGLRIFAEVAAALMKSGHNMTEALQMMSRLPVELSGRPYRDVIWLTTGKIEAGARPICRRLLLYMLGHEPAKEDLIERYAKLLGVDAESVKLPGRLN
jgi:DNA sulfur modification protein DndB